MNPPESYWEKRFLNQTDKELFYAAYASLPAKYQGVVDEFLTILQYDKHPWITYKCGDCRESRKNMYLCNASHGMEGEKIVQVVVWFNPKYRWIVPLHCELV